MITLAIDASTYAGSVAILDDGGLLAEETVAMRGMHEERLMPAVAAALSHAGRTVGDVDRVVCGAGPGSFTSLRIAGGIAKGIATGLNRPLFAVPSLGLIVAATPLPPGRYLATLDALRDERYVALYDVDQTGEVHEVAEAWLIPAATLDEIAVDRGAHIVGPDRHATDAAGAARSTGAPHARGVMRLRQLIEQRGEVDISGWEPQYGRVAEAQRRWESTHGRPLTSA